MQCPTDKGVSCAILARDKADEDPLQEYIDALSGGASRRSQLAGSPPWR